MDHNNSVNTIMDQFSTSDVRGHYHLENNETTKAFGTLGGIDCQTIGSAVGVTVFTAPFNQKENTAMKTLMILLSRHKR